MKFQAPLTSGTKNECFFCVKLFECLFFLTRCKEVIFTKRCQHYRIPLKGKMIDLNIR